MNRKQNPNMEILQRAVDQLEELADKMVFVGGCATGLLITDKAAPPIRITRDVDVIVEVASLSDYYHLSEQLRTKGFSEDQQTNAPLCRWLGKNIILDIMPTDEKVLGFGNQWYSPAMKYATQYSLPVGKKIKMISAPYFLITKLEAFKGRGNGDYLASHDIEDIVAVIDGRPEIFDEVAKTDEPLRTKLASSFDSLLNDNNFVTSIAGHMPTDDNSQGRASLVMTIMENISKISRTQ